MLVHCISSVKHNQKQIFVCIFMQYCTFLRMHFCEHKACSKQMNWWESVSAQSLIGLFLIGCYYGQVGQAGWIGQLKSSSRCRYKQCGDLSEGHEILDQVLPYTEFRNSFLFIPFTIRHLRSYVFIYSYLYIKVQFHYATEFLRYNFKPFIVLSTFDTMNCIK